LNRLSEDGTTLQVRSTRHSGKRRKKHSGRERSIRAPAARRLSKDIKKKEDGKEEKQRSREEDAAKGKEQPSQVWVKCSGGTKGKREKEEESIKKKRIGRDTRGKIKKTLAGDDRCLGKDSGWYRKKGKEKTRKIVQTEMGPSSKGCDRGGRGWGSRENSEREHSMREMRGRRRTSRPRFRETWPYERVRTLLKLRSRVRNGLGK